MVVFFALLVGSTLLVLVFWAGTMVYRLYHPEQPRPFAEPPVVQREQAAEEGKAVPVGVREIRADRRRERRTQEVQSSYAWGRSQGIPDAWHDDLWHRRN